MMAPITPHITEEIYQLGFKQREKVKSIHLQEWPEFNVKEINQEVEELGDLGVHIINTVRKFKSEKQLSLKAEIQELILVSKEKQFESKIKKIIGDLKAVLNVKKLNFQGKTNLETDQFKVKIGVNL